MPVGTPIDLTAFPPERIEKLSAIWRYNLFETLLYRSNNWMHEQRVHWLTEVIGTLLAPFADFDLEKARTLALVHDDAEILTGDVQAGHKTQMTKEELAAVDRAEEEAIEELCKTYPETVNGYSYKQLLTEALKKDTFEAQLVSYADKMDAYCEGLHEQLAGNSTLICSTILYTRFFSQVRDRLPLIVSALDKAEKHPFIYPFILPPVPGRMLMVADHRKYADKPHTAESVHIPSVTLPFYDEWKKVVLAHDHEDWLITQREFLPA